MNIFCTRWAQASFGGLCLLWLCAMSATLRAGEESTRKVKTLPVKVVPVKRGSIRSHVVAAGTATAVRRDFLTFRKSGRVIELGQEGKDKPLKEGSLVKKGQLLARIEDDDARQEILIRTASYQEAENQYKLAQQKFERGKELQGKGLLTPAEFESRKTQALNAKSQMESANVQLENAKRSHGDYTLTAPFDGLLTFINIRMGDFTGPNALNNSSTEAMLKSAPFVIIDPSAYEVILEMPVYDAQLVEVGQEAYITPSGMPLPADAESAKMPVVQAKVFSVSPAITPESRGMRVRVRTSGSAGYLSPGVYVNCTIIVAYKKDALKLTREALIFRDNSLYVFAVDAKNVAHKRVLRTGLTAPDSVEVVEGLAEGDKVVTDGRYHLVDGVHVEIVESQSAAVDQE